MKILPVILSGGSGTRLWPVSRSGYPKQLQPLHGQGTLLQQTGLRLAPGGEVLPPVVICNEEQRFIVAEQLREVGIAPSLIALEPAGRNTAPALAAAAVWVENPEQTIIVALPADHYIADSAAFRAAVDAAAPFAAAGRLMTFGVTPVTPHTGYGYIEKGEAIEEGGAKAFALAAFKEKPDAATAEKYLKDGLHLWNAGIFVFRADVFLRELEKLQPAMVASCRKAVAGGARDLDFLRLDKDAFLSAPSLSVDYALMEHTRHAGVVPVSFAWSDLGGWHSLWELGPPDARGNVFQGDVVTHDVRNSFARAEHRLVALLGLDNVTVVETADAILVADSRRTEQIREIVAQLKQQGRPEESSHRRVWRPWGYFEGLQKGEGFQVKLIMVKPGAKLSLQKHAHRAEHWIIVTGTARVTCNERVFDLGPNESADIPLGAVHRLENPGTAPLIVIEVQSGGYLGEDDIVRLEDTYNRAPADGAKG